jgi:tetratricopeptide (TPR) repeat protein
MAQLLCNQGRADQAEQLEREALAIHERNLDPAHPIIADDLCTLSVTLRALGRSTEAEQLLRQALVIDEKTSDSDHPNVGLRLNNLAMLLRDTNRLAEAEPLSRRAVEIIVKSAITNGYAPRGSTLVFDVYTDVLKRMGRSQQEVRAQLNAFCLPSGINLGDALAVIASQKEPTQNKSWWKFWR